MSFSGDPPLADRHGRTHTYLRISLTDQCNFRCRYCMPPDGLDWLPREELLTPDEIVHLTRVFVKLGVDKVRLTGGEPSVRKELEEIIGRISEIEGVRRLLMTTNGVTLKRKASEYKRLGLHGLNISLDTLKPDRFKEITLRDRFEDVIQGIDAAVAAGFDSVKVNAVVIKGVNDDEILDFVRFVQDRPVNVRFIEFMPFKENGWSNGDLVPYRAMRELIESQHKLIPLEAEPTAVGKDFAIPGFAGTVSFVTSMTESFCEGCNRVRLTAEGNLKPCLFWHAETPLRDQLRAGATDEEIEAIIRTAVLGKPRGHAPLTLLPMVENRSMVQIGG